MKQELVICVIKNSKGEFLLNKKSANHLYYPGRWCFFGGKAKSRNLKKEMIRELKEEAGIMLNPKFIFTKDILTKKGKMKIHVFSEKINEITKVKLGEGAGFAFFQKKELNNLKIGPDVKFMMKYLKLK